MNKTYHDATTFLQYLLFTTQLFEMEQIYTLLCCSFTLFLLDS